MICSCDASCFMRKILFFWLRFFTKHQQSITAQVISQFLRGICTRRPRLFTETLFLLHICKQILLWMHYPCSVHLDQFLQVSTFAGCWRNLWSRTRKRCTLSLVFINWLILQVWVLRRHLVACNWQSCELCGEFIAFPCHSIASPWANRWWQCAHKQYAGKRGGAQHFRWTASRPPRQPRSPSHAEHLRRICSVYLSSRFSRVSLFRSSAVWGPRAWPKVVSSPERRFFHGPRDLESVEERPE